MTLEPKSDGFTARQFLWPMRVVLSVFICALQPTSSAQAELPLEPAQTLSQSNSVSASESLDAPLWRAAEKDSTLEQLAIERRDNEALQNSVMAKFESDIKACESKFTVTDCKLDVMAKKNAQMRELKQVEHAIKVQERAIKAADKKETLQNKQSPLELQKKETQAKEHEKAFDQHMLEHEKALQSHDAKRAGTELTPMAEEDLSSQQHLKAPHAGKNLEAQTQAQAAYEKKQNEAKEHEAAVKRKLAEKTNPAAALPDPTIGNNRKALP